MRPVQVSTTDASAAATYSSVVIPDIYLTPANLSIGVIVTGTVNYTVQATLDDVFSTSFNASTATWYDHPTLVSQTANGASNYAFPVRGVRLKQSSGSGSCVMNVVQSGVQ